MTPRAQFTRSERMDHVPEETLQQILDSFAPYPEPELDPILLEDVTWELLLAIEKAVGDLMHTALSDAQSKLNQDLRHVDVRTICLYLCNRIALRAARAVTEKVSAVLAEADADFLPETWAGLPDNAREAVAKAFSDAVDAAVRPIETALISCASDAFVRAVPAMRALPAVPADSDFLALRIAVVDAVFDFVGGVIVVNVIAGMYSALVDRVLDGYTSSGMSSETEE